MTDKMTVVLLPAYGPPEAAEWKCGDDGEARLEDLRAAVGGTIAAVPVARVGLGILTLYADDEGLLKVDSGGAYRSINPWVALLTGRYLVGDCVLTVVDRAGRTLGMPTDIVEKILGPVRPPKPSMEVKVLDKAMIEALFRGEPI